ncbi:MAG: hypothetical protein M1420_04005 [Actinobacteria bacterium]|nr:hypothetical protein [Actinomycetota bacterium]
MFANVHSTGIAGGSVPCPFLTKGSRYDNYSVLPVIDALAPFFPYGGMQKGAFIEVLSSIAGNGACTLAISLLAAASSQGAWCAIAGLTDLGLLATCELGVDLNRMVMVSPPTSSRAPASPFPPAEFWQATATLLKGIDIVLLNLSLQDTYLQRYMYTIQRLAAIARKYNSICIVLVSGMGTLLQGQAVRNIGASVIMEVVSSKWLGPSGGFGRLHSRVALVESTGRGAAARPVRRTLYLPGSDGKVATAG